MPESLRSPRGACTALSKRTRRQAGSRVLTRGATGLARWCALGLLAGLVLLAGCAGSRKPERSPELEDVPRAGGVRLPGLDRRLPSEMNDAPPSAPEAFPALASASQGEARPGGEPLRGGESRQTLPPNDRTGTPSSPAPGAVRAPSGPVDYSVQLSATSTEWGARDRVRAWAPLFQDPLRIDEEDGLYKVRLGRYPDAAAAAEARNLAAAAGLTEAFVVEVAR